ncbi:hypothetical protein [Streptococcus suis]|uniref:hypothetical protein n=1 Tax=Streptococcus suis TaxID=1307 RepID=UPI0038B879B2
MSADIQFYVENTIHTDYSSSLFFAKLKKSSQQVVSGLSKQALYCLDGVNTRLLYFLKDDLNLPINSDADTKDKSIIYMRTSKPQLLKCDEVYIYDPEGVINKDEFSKIRKNVQKIHYLTNETVFDKNFLNFVTKNNHIFISQSVFVNRKYCYKASLLFNNTSEAFLRLYTSGILTQAWYHPKGYIGLKEINSTGTLILVEEGSSKNIGTFESSIIKEQTINSNSVKENQQYGTIMEAIGTINENNRHLLTELDRLSKELSKMKDQVGISSNSSEEDDPLEIFRN